MTIFSLLRVAFCSHSLLFFTMYNMQFKCTARGTSPILITRTRTATDRVVASVLVVNGLILKHSVFIAHLSLSIARFEWPTRPRRWRK